MHKINQNATNEAVSMEMLMITIKEIIAMENNYSKFLVELY